MRVYKRMPEEVLGVINRCYLEADQGRVSLSLDRLRELDREFPDNAHIAYAEGQIRRDYLGEGPAARRLFAKAYELAVAQKLSTETAWFAICNLVQLAPSVEQYQKWADIALAEKGKSQPECVHYREVLQSLKSGVPLFDLLSGASIEAMKSGEFGSAAALAEVALEVRPDLKREEELELRKHRSNCLRQLDAAASNHREAYGERFPPDERVALHRALDELDRAIELDKFDAALWNYRSAWCHLLERYSESVAAADEAIKLRPHRYPRPYINKSQSLWALEKDQEALACAEEGLRQTEGSGLPPDTVEQSRALIAMYSAGRSEPTLKVILPLAARIIDSVRKMSDEEFTQLRRGRVTPGTVESRLLGHLPTVQENPIKGYIPMMAEALASFTPESMARVTASLPRKDRTVPEYCIAAALYVAAHAEGVHRRDAARYLCLMTLFLGDPAGIRQYYRQAFLAVSVAATDAMSKVESIVREEFERINSVLPRLLADQEPITEPERWQATSNVLSHLAGPPPEPGIGMPPPSGCATPALALALIAPGVVLVSSWCAALFR